MLTRQRRSSLTSATPATHHSFSTTESLLTSCKASDWKYLQRVVRIVEQIIGTQLPSISDIALVRCLVKGPHICSRPHPPPPWAVFPVAVWQKVLHLKQIFSSACFKSSNCLCCSNVKPILNILTPGSPLLFGRTPLL